MVDWSPFGGNPVPGDPVQVKVLASAFHNFAHDVDSQNSLLKALKADTTGVWEGPAADAFRPHLDDLPPKLDKLVTSYREAGDALVTYAPKLAHAQDEALAALHKATEAMARLGQAKTNKANQDAANKRAADAATPDHPAPTVIQPDYGAAITQAQADLNKAHSDKDAAVSDARSAAKACVSAIKQAANDGIKNKHHHWWDTVIDVITHPVKLLKVISLVANTLSGIFAICALVTCWIPGVGEFFEAASLVTGLVGLAADLTLAMMGKGSWSSVLLDAVGVGTAGVGHLLGTAADAGKVVASGEKAVTEGEAALQKSAELKTAARTLLQTGKGGKAASKAARAQAAAMRAEAGELTIAGKALTKSGNEAIQSGSNALKYGATQTATKLPPYVGYVGQHLPTAAADAFSRGGAALRQDGVVKTFTTYFGSGNAAVAGWRGGSVAVNAYGAGAVSHGAYNDDVAALNGHAFDAPPSLDEQLTEFENNADPLVLTGVTGEHGGGGGEP
jgi:uncharacterized protein YukE